MQLDKPSYTSPESAACTNATCIRSGLGIRDFYSLRPRFCSVRIEWRIAVYENLFIDNNFVMTVKIIVSAHIQSVIVQEIALSNRTSLVCLQYRCHREGAYHRYNASRLVYLVSGFIHCGWRVCTHIIECDSKSKQPLRTADVTQWCNCVFDEYFRDASTRRGSLSLPLSVWLFIYY